ncbi:uncharacterized protein LOC144122972 [Amblyomma americanum]
MSRKKWMEKGLANLTALKDLSRVRAIRYGIANESDAILRYKDTMIAAGHPVEIINCGIFVNPTKPWLGASPDAIAFDPCEPFPWGTVEVKCPYSLRDATKEDLLSQDFFVEFDENCLPTLKKDHEHYMQVLGQMGVTQTQWADFVVFGPHFLIVQRLRFCEEEWSNMEAVLNSFYFNTLLPFMVKQLKEKEM